MDNDSPSLRTAIAAFRKMTGLCDRCGLTHAGLGFLWKCESCGAVVCMSQIRIRQMNTTALQLVKTQEAQAERMTGMPVEIDQVINAEEQIALYMQEGLIEFGHEAVSGTKSITVGWVCGPIHIAQVEFRITPDMNVSVDGIS